MGDPSAPSDPRLGGFELVCGDLPRLHGGVKAGVQLELAALAALAVYMRERHPDIDVEYFFTDTGKDSPRCTGSWTNSKDSSASRSYG